MDQRAVDVIEPSPRQVAFDIEAAYCEGPVRGSEVLVSYLAGEIDVVHEPPQQGDGPRPGPLIGARRIRETLAFEKALSNFREDTRIEVDDDCLLVRKTLRGKRSSGVEFIETVLSKMRVRGGKIVQVIAATQSASFQTIAEVLREGGFTG